MFGWLFKKKKKAWPVPARLYSYTELAAEFFVMWPADQYVFLRMLEVAKPRCMVDAANPSTNIQALIDWKIEKHQLPLTADQFFTELRNLLEAGKRQAVIGVLQQIFRDLNETEEYVKALEKLHKDR